MSRSQLISWVVLGVVFALLIALRAMGELAMMNEHGSDPQMPAWIVEFVIIMAIWFVAGLPAFLILAFVRRSWSWAPALVWILLWGLWIGFSSWSRFEGARALADAADPATSPERLVELVHFRGAQAGYELDNRIASNPQTPATALRLLYQRQNIGTLMCLARNPNTPPDILDELSAYEDELIQQSLSQNPKRPTLIRQGLQLLGSPKNIEQSKHVTLTVIEAKQHLGHNITESGGHSVWIDACRGRLADSDEEFVIWWNGGEIRDHPFQFETGKTYRLAYEGDLETGVMGFEGKCIHIKRLKSVQEQADKR